MGQANDDTFTTYVEELHEQVGDAVICLQESQNLSGDGHWNENGQLASVWRS